MNIGFMSCGILVLPFALIAVLFAMFKDKVAKFVSGFNSLPKEEQALYDKAFISRDMKKQCFTWATIMLLEAVISYFFGAIYGYFGLCDLACCIFKEVHFDSHKTFEKYLLK